MFLLRFLKPFFYFDLRTLFYFDFGGMAGAAIGGLFDIATSALNNKYQQQQMQLQNQLNIDQWNRENQYNSPTAQMQRLSAAGLNPNLVYGNGATTLSASSPKLEAAQKKAPDLGQYAVMAVNAMLKQKELDIREKEVDSKVNLNASQANWNKVRSDLDDLKLALEEVTFNNSVAKSDLTLQKLRETIDNLNASTRNYESMIGLNAYRAENLESQTKLNDVKVEETIARIANINSDTAVKEADKLLRDSQLKLTNEQVTKVIRESAQLLLTGDLTKARILETLTKADISIAELYNLINYGSKHVEAGPVTREAFGLLWLAKEAIEGREVQLHDLPLYKLKSDFHGKW